MVPKEWEIIIDQFDGFVPGFWKNSLATFGNKSHASDMQHIDLTDPNVLTQGPGLAALTNGTQAAEVSTLIKGMMKNSVDGTNCFGVGGNKLYKFTSTSVVDDANWAHTITAASGTAAGEDVAYYGGQYFYSYNYTGAGDVGRTNGTSTFDDNFMSTVPTDGAVLTAGVPHQMVVGGNDVLYIANGRYVASYDGTTFVAHALDLPAGEEVSSIAWDHNRLYITSNRPDVSTAVYTLGSIYLWDTFSTSWEYQITIPGKVGASFSKNGLMYVWYQDMSSIGGYKIAYVTNNQLKDINSYTGSLPNYYQVIDDQNHLLWLSSGEVWAWGAQTNDLSVKMFKYAEAGNNTTTGGITNVFGTPMIASHLTAGGLYQLAKFSGYDVNAQWKTIYFQLASSISKARVTRVVVYTEPLATGAKMDTTLNYDFGKSSVALSQIAYSAAANTTKHIIYRDGVEVENFSLALSWANGSATNPVKVRAIHIIGEFLDDN